MKVVINYQDPRWKKFKIDFESIINTAAGKSDKNSEVSIILTNDKHILKLNKQYRDLDTPTNVLSFESGDNILLGDIYISFDTVMKEVNLDSKEFINHTIHMVVHGVLHLLGYDHLKKMDTIKMERTEIKILKNLGINNPYKESDSLGFFNKLKSDKFSYLKAFIFFVLGLVSFMGFAPFNLGIFTVLSLGLVYYFYFFNKDKQKLWPAFLNIFPFGAGYALGMFWWILNSIYVVPELSQQFAIWTIPGLVGIGLIGGLVFSIPFVSIRCMPLKSTYRPILFAASWTVVLWLREWLFTGFPWNPIANITMPIKIVSNSMAVFGALGLTFIIIGLIASIVEYIKNRKKTFWTLCLFVKLALSVFILGFINIEKSEIKNKDESGIIRIVQPAKSGSQKASHSRAQALKNSEENIDNLVRLAKSPGDFDFVVFPETSYPYIVYKDGLDFVKKIGTPVIIGSLSYNNRKLYNSLIITDKSGAIQKIYSKTHLVPFGEYRPFGDIIPTPGQLTSGDGPEVLTIKFAKKSFNFVPAICYEVVFSNSLVPRNSNPHAVINITNDTWFGKTPGTYQHLDMVRRYAIESGLPIVRANYSGISAFVAADGDILSMLPVQQSGVLDGAVFGHHITLYRFFGRDKWMIIILLFSIISAVCISLLQKKD